VPAPSAFGVVGVDGPPLDGGERIVDETRLVQRVGVNGYLTKKQGRKRFVRGKTRANPK